MTTINLTQSEAGPKTEAFDAVIVGTGQAAPALAHRLTQAGLTVAVVERGQVGGTCVNAGCTPTKAMVASAFVARAVQRAAEFGVLGVGRATVDLAVVHRRVQAIVEADRTGLEAWLGSMPGCTFVRGHARFVDGRALEVDGRRLRAPRIFLNVGGRASAPPIPGLDSVDYLTNTGMLALTETPRRLVVVGGSYVGLEFAQMFRRFGAAVTVIERGPRLLGREDEDVSEHIRVILEAEGVEVRLGANCLAVEPSAEGVAVHVGGAQTNSTVTGTHLLVALGRRPNTDDLGLDKAGVETDEHGFIRVDERLRTNVDGVWALGDCNGRGAFTHTAYDDFEIVAANLLDGADRSLAERIPAYGLFIDPPLGRVGMTLAQARASGRRLLVGERPMTRVARAVEKGDTRGLMRVVVDRDTDEILGAAILGPGGDEAVHEVLAAMAAGAPASRLARTMAIHPTVSELIPTIFNELKPV